MLKKLLLFGFCLLALPWLPQPAVAQALDPTFTPPTGLYALGGVYSMAAQQADGKRVVAGFFTRANNTAVGSLVRLDVAGALDADFAQNVGVARNTTRVKALPNGQYLVSGFDNIAVTAGGLTRPGLLRLNANGTADATFNAGSGAANSGSGVFLNTFVGQPDGKVLVGGTFTSFSGQNASGLVRLTTTGALDAAFDGNIGTGFDGTVYAVAVQADGKLLVGGAFYTFKGQTTGPLLRLNADGTRDPTFATSITSGYVGSLLVQPDGKVLATGVLTSNSVTSSIVRLTATGAADTGFAAPGYTTNYASSYFDTNVQLQPDGKIIFSGGFSSGSNVFVTRLNANGSADNSFSVPTPPSQYPYSIGLQSDGSLWLGGSFTSFNGREAALGRLTSSGSADATFTPKLQTAGDVTAVVRQADGQLLLGGNFTEFNGVAVHYLARVSAAGTPDAAFTAAAAAVVGAPVTALALQADGKLVVGTTNSLLRLLATGAADASYSKAATNTGIEKLALQPDGNVLAVGYFTNVGGNGASAYVVRLTTSGEYDNSFNAAAAPGQTFYLTALALQPDGKVLVGGSFFLPGSSGPVLRVVRYESTGAVDASFSSGTTFEVPTRSSGAIVRFNTLALQPDGKVLVGGYFATVNGTARTNLARLTATGQLDATFAPVALTGAIAAIALQPNGRILVGSSYGNDGSPNITPLIRLLTTGANDPSFGVTATPNDAVTALLVQPDEAIVVGGSFSAIGGQPASGLARIIAPNVLAVLAPTAATELSVWPVPVHGLLHVAVQADAQAAELLDALGRVVRQQALRGAGKYTVATEALPAGVYVLRVQYVAGWVARRVVVE